MQLTHLSSEPAEESKNELRESEDKVLVEEVAQKGSHSVIRPATMHKQQTLQKPTQTGVSKIHKPHTQETIRKSTCILKSEWTCDALVISLLIGSYALLPNSEYVLAEFRMFGRLKVVD